MPIAEAGLPSRNGRVQPGRLLSFAGWALQGAARLTSPKCPRCGARGPAASTRPSEDHHAFCYEVECRTCGHGWTVVAADPLLGP